MVTFTEKTLPERKPMRVRYRGEYDYDGLLALIRGFYKRSFFNLLKEPKFKYKVGGTGGAEVEFKFVADRNVTHYIKIYLYVVGHLWEVKRNTSGRTKGKVEFYLSAKVVYNYGKTFRKEKSIEQWMQQRLDMEGTGLQFGDNYVTGEKYIELLIRKLYDEIKKHLNMECV